MARGGTGLINQDQSFGSAYEISLPAFQGPVQLLLHLIEREQLAISEVSLVSVTDQYLRAIGELESLDADALASFLDVASRLLYIKSSRLLPRPQVDDEQEEDAGELLVRRLLEYRQFKQAANSLRERADTGQRAFVRPAVTPPVLARPAGAPEIGDIDLSELQAALKRALDRIPVEPPAPTVQPYTVTVAEQIERIRDKVRLIRDQSHPGGSRSSIAFSQLLRDGYSRIEVIVTFMAVLELIRLQELHVRQSGTFGEIELWPADSDNRSRQHRSESRAGATAGLSAEDES